MGLAYAEVAKNHSLDPLSPYLALRDLGLQPGLQDYQAAHLYTTMNPVLSDWIRSGETGRTVAEGLAVRRAGDAATASERQQAAIDVLEESRRGYIDALGRLRGGGARRLESSRVRSTESGRGCRTTSSAALTELEESAKNLSLVSDEEVM